MLEKLFWLTLLSIVYCYFGYPLLIKLIRKIRSNRIDKSPMMPTVTIVLSVYNEEDVIEEKLDNLLSLDYPADKMAILVGSDGSDDQTVNIVKKFADDRIHLVENHRRRGKMIVLNDLVKKVQNEIIIFTDARQTFAHNAIKELVGNFSDKKVGCVSGELLFSKQDSPTAKGVGLYWSYEKDIRRSESHVHSMLGATGAIYAIRKELYEPIPGDVVLDDMYVPFKIIQKGYRAIFDDSAKAFDEAANDPKEEHRRKARTLAGNYQMFSIFGHMFNPFTSPIAIQLFSHKLLRVIMPFCLLGLFIINILILDIVFYNILFKAQLLFYGMALIGNLVKDKNYGLLGTVAQLCYVPYVFCLLNFSALIGFLRFAGSKQEVTWEKARG